MKFKGILPERKLWVKIAVLLIAVYIIFNSIAAGKYIYVLLGALVIGAVFFKKEQVISEKGVDIITSVFGVSSVNHWEWDEVTTMHTDYTKAKPNVMLHIGKDIVTRTYIMTKADCQGALRLAEQMNPKIFIEDLTEEELEQREMEMLRKQQAARAQRAAEKKAKKKKK